MSNTKPGDDVTAAHGGDCGGGVEISRALGRAFRGKKLKDTE